MAVGTGIGLNLSDLDNAFKKADQHIKNLTDKTNGLQKQTINAFQQMAQKGVLPYVEALKQQKKYLEEISKSKGSGAFFTNMQKEAKSTVDEINKVISSLEKTKAFRNESSGKSAMSFANSVLGKGGEVKSIDNMRKALQQLEDAQNRQNLGTARGRKNYEKIGETIRRVKEELDKATGSNKKLTEEIQKTQGEVSKLGGMITAAFALNTLKRFITQMIQVRGEFELQHRSLQVLLQDKDKADELWNKTIELAVKSPFRVKDLVTYTKQLAAYRVEADKLYETNKMLADVSAGLGVDMNRLILAFGQVKAANFLRGTELRQFSEAGVNMLEELAKRFTMLEGRAVSVGDVFERVSKRMVSFKDVEAVFKTITSEGGTFYKMQEKQSETTKGMIMNLKDSIDLMFNDLGSAHEGTIKNMITLVRNLVDNWEKFRPVISGITMALITTLVGHGVAKVISGFSAAIKVVRMLWKVIAEGAKMKTLTAGPWIALATVLVGVVTTIAQAINSANRLQKELDKIYAEDTGNLEKSISRYQDLVNRLREANQGSQERRDIIEKLNKEYGQYLDFVVTEQTEIDKLVNSYDILVARMKEKAAVATYEKAFAEISDKYSKKIQEAREDLEDALEVNKVSIKGKDIFSGEQGVGKIIPTENEINDIYRTIEQRLQNINSEEAKRYKTLAGQQQLLNSIISGYYGEEYMASFAKSSDATNIIDVLLERKQKELEIEEQISLAYRDSLNSRKARLEYDKLELEYSERQGEIRNQKNTSRFEVNKMLDELKKEFELNKIEIKFKFGQIGEEERDRLRNQIINWATETTKDVNDEIRRNLSNFMTEEEWSNFLITPDKQSQGMSGIIKEIIEGYKQQDDIIKQQLSLKSAGRKIDEKDLEIAQKRKKAYEEVASILGIELKKHTQISEELRKQINDLMPQKQKISLEDSYKSVKEIQDETNKSYKEQLATMETLINQKRAGVAIDHNALDVAYEDLKILQEKMKLLGMKVDEPMSDTTRHSINYSLPEEFKISEADALKGVSAINKEASAAFEKAQKELQILLDMQDEEVEGIEDQISLLNQQLPYLQKKVELTGTQLKDRLTEQQLIEINGQLEQQHHLQEINLYKERSTVISEIQGKAKEIEGNILTMEEMRREGLTIDETKLKNLEQEYLINKKILNLLDHTQEKAIATQKVNDINAKLQSKYRIGVIDSQKSEITLLKEAEQERDKAIAYEAQLNRMKAQGVTITAEELALVKEEVAQYTLKANLLGAEPPKVRSRKENLYEERIRVIDDMNKKYQELAKTLPEVEARQGAFNAYIDAFASAYKGIKWIPSNVRKMSADEFMAKVLNFPNEDAIVTFFDKLEKNAKKKADKIKVELAKGQYVLDMKVRVQKESDKELFKDIQDMFDKYELSLELKKLNIPPELAKSLFNLDTHTLDELKRGVTDAFMGIENYEEQVKNAAKIMKEAFNGNVDLLNRKLIPAQELVNKGWKDVGDGIATVFSSQHGIQDAKGNEVEILVTPILPDGTVMSESELESYIKNTLSGAEDILKADTKGIVIHAGLEMDENMGETLHTLQEVFYAAEMLSEDQKDKYADFLAKIAEMDKKAALERMKTYSKYLLSGMSESVKLKIEEMRKLKEIEESKEFTEPQKARIKKGVSEEARKEQQKQEWKDFKESDMYTMMFEDLEHYGTEAINMLYTKLTDLKKSLSDLPANEVKEIISQIEKLENIKIERNPFQELVKYRKEVKNIDFSEEELQGQLRGLQEREAHAQRILDVIRLMEQATNEGISQSDALAQLTPEQLTAWNTALSLQGELGVEMSKVADKQEGIVKKSKENQIIVVGQLSSYKKLSKSQQEAYKKTETWLNAVGDVFSASKELMTALGVESDSVAMTIADTGSSMVSLILSAVQFTAQMQLLGVASNMALGVIGWIAIALQAVATLLTAIFSAKDNQLKKQVEAHQRTVENLLESYEELEKKIDEAWNVEAVRQYNTEMRQTMSLAMDAQKAAIAAQEQRKGADKEGSDAWQELQDMKAELDEMEQQLEDSLRESFSKITDGILDDVFSVAKEFTDAWYEAFKETRDGLSGLEENFNEMFMNLAKNQAAMQITGAFVEEWKRDLQKYLNDTDTRLTPEEAVAWADEVKATMPELSAALEAFLGTIHESVGGLQSGELSSLQKGIQGITEDTAQVIEAYLNSVRGYVSEQVTYTKRIYEMFDRMSRGNTYGLNVRMIP